MPIKKLGIDWLGPFSKIEFEFDRQVNAFVGPNNCGKSTVLLALAEATVVGIIVPERFYRSDRLPILRINLWDEESIIKHKLPWVSDSEVVVTLKKIGYTSFVPALRHNTGFRPQSPIGETRVRSRQRELRIGRELYEPEGGEPIDDTEIYGERIQRIFDRAKPKLSKKDKKELDKRKAWTSNSSRITDQAMITKIVALDYRAYRKGDERFRKVLSLIADIASEIMIGFPLAFDHIEEDNRGFYPQFSTPDGPLPLDKLSQGTQSIIQWLTQLLLGMAEYYDFPQDLRDKQAIFIIDEIDAHMHPEWQLRIIPAITKNLPNCQLFVSTHSPLILSGLKYGQAQLFRRDKNNKVIVTRNEEETFGWSVDEIMRWLMGMKDTVDIETQGLTDKLMMLRGRNKLTESEQKQLDNLRKEIHERLVKKQGIENK